MNPECDLKKCYTSFSAAKIAARKMTRKRDLHPYRCRVCGGIHLGHTNKRKTIKPKSFDGEREDISEYYRRPITPKKEPK